MCSSSLIGSQGLSCRCWATESIPPRAPRVDHSIQARASCKYNHITSVRLGSTGTGPLGSVKRWQRPILFDTPSQWVWCGFRTLIFIAKENQSRSTPASPGEGSARLYLGTSHPSSSHIERLLMLSRKHREATIRTMRTSARCMASSALYNFCPLTFSKSRAS